MINSQVVCEATGLRPDEFEVHGLGVASSKSFTSHLSFIDDSRYLIEANANDCLKAVFVTKELSSLLREDIFCIEVDDPKWYFFSLINYLCKTKVRKKTSISASAIVHKTAYVSEVGVIIEDDVLIEPNVTIMADVIIRKGAIIRAGAVLGVDGYEHKKTLRGLLSVSHDGHVIVEENVEVGVNCNIAKGFAYRDTIIGSGTKLDALVHYAHGVQCGMNCMLVASSMIGGNVTLGENVWVGPNATISNRIVVGNNAFITLGSVVVKDVGDGEKVTGNFAMPHLRFIRNLKASMR